MSSVLRLFEGYGIEIETMVVDAETLDVRPIVDELLKRGADTDAYVGEVEDGAIAPDVTTLLHQSVVPPWGAQLVVGPDGEPRRAEADPRPVEAIAADVIAAAPLAGDDLAADDLAGLAALVAAAGAPDVGRRERLWGGSPVPSNRFE